MLFPDVQKFILDLYAMPRDASYYVKLPDLPENIKNLLKE